MKFQSVFIAVYLFLISLFLCAPTKAHAQQKARSQFTVLGGYSFNSIKFLGKTGNSQTQIISLGFQKPIHYLHSDRLIWYTAEIIPYLHFQYPKRDEGNRFVSRSGFGLSPIGFTITRTKPKMLSPYIKTTGGIIYMESNFPTNAARRLNFTFDITLGGNFMVNSFGMISFGYKFHHISNAETGRENPGLDSNFLFLKFSTH